MRWLSQMRWFFLFAALTVLLDQATKHLIMEVFQEGDFRVVIPGVLNLCRVHNPGAAWGIFSGMRFFLVAFAGLSLILFSIFHHRIFGEHPAIRLFSGILVGGIAGNLIDRVRFGYVVDFLDFHHGDWHFPAFNVADSAITGGVLLLLIAQAVIELRRKPEAAAENEASEADA